MRLVTSTLLPLFQHHTDADPCLDAPPSALGEPPSPTYDPTYPLSNHRYLTDRQ